jgi:hypothetical protein
VYPSVIVAKSCNFFPTLGKIPTGTIPSAMPWVLVAKFHNLFPTLG